MSQHFLNHGYYTARVSKIYHMRVPGDITAGVDGPDHAASWTERFNCQAPEQWTFSTNHYGRPEISPPGRLRFNLSHTRGLAAVLVALEVDCGVDVEQRRQMRDLFGRATHVFSAAEVDSLRPLSTEGQHERFFDYWTLKESYIKARGMGLSLPLQQFTFSLNQGITISFDPRMKDDPARWQFERFAPTPDHAMAVALRMDRRPPLQIAVQTWHGPEI